ncbi:hypothetical protein FTO68_11060 [Methanocalculus taiwanensis]|uniref:Uncharacterized protein n=1 Tax=Methanocalculus taiwanensis TaxID=106207 RepID=A0ABD4TM57_9EURY|nr:hypothetical protein [Methanocalculus taiwanensis]MCQ1539516.1 hypothetical protein [Methanocalculus taiwanensis]
MKSFIDKVIHRNQKKRRSFSLKIETQNSALLTDDTIAEALTELAQMIKRGEGNLDIEGKVRYIIGDVVLEGRMDIEKE